MVHALTTRRDINSSGVVVGDSTVAEDQGHAFIWQSGTLTDLGTLGGAESDAFGINEANVVVGTANTADGSSRAYVYSGLTGMIDLNSLAPAATNAGLTLEVAYDINDRGAIVGQARENATSDQKGFLLKPGAILEGALADGTFNAEGYSELEFGVAGLPSGAISLGQTIALENFSLLTNNATLRLPYEEADVAEAGLSEDDLRLYWYDEDNSTWVKAGPDSNVSPGGQLVLGAPTDVTGDYGVDTEHNLVWANIDHASTYGVFAIPEPATGVLTLAALAAGVIVRRRRGRRLPAGECGLPYRAPERASAPVARSAVRPARGDVLGSLLLRFDDRTRIRFRSGADERAGGSSRDVLGDVLLRAEHAWNTVWSRRISR
ncbi:HAF repeat-containing PEP-CTERM protein [Kiritimatiella glycovorans]|uniref:HAF repeat-containing PEP-CTERM protein n=1 Tax=Kiritimatiella glycovorans TaxID=1307763 RepID=UPI00069927F9|nr:HAF repeat-containing PEP-CTERM protein [Kiritimatiella glycovorans]